MSELSSADVRLKRLLASQSASVSFAGDDAIETRPSFMGAVHDYLTENKAGVALKKVFFAGMAALALSSAMAAPAQFDVSANHAPTSGIHFVDTPDHALNKIATDHLFEDKSKFDGVFKSLAQDFNLELVSGDIHDSDSINNFAETLVSKGIKSGFDLASYLVNNENDVTPVAMQFFSGVDAAGVGHHVAAITYDSNHNHLIGEVFGSLEKINFGQDINKVVENATWIHESMHAIIKSSELTGLEAWKSALNGDFKAYDTWHNSVQAQVSHPEVRALIESEIAVLQTHPAEYDTGNFLTAVRAVQKSVQYENYQENMADGLMSTKSLQDGFSISHEIADARAARAGSDAVHDTSVGQKGISEHLSTSLLQGKNATELASITAKTVQTAMGYDTHDFVVADNHVADGLSRMIGDASQAEKGVSGGEFAGVKAPSVPLGRLSSTLSSRSVGDRFSSVQHNSFTVAPKVVGEHEFVVDKVVQVPSFLMAKGHDALPVKAVSPLVLAVPSPSEIMDSFDVLSEKLANYPTSDVQLVPSEKRSFVGTVVAESDLHIGLHIGRGVLLVCEKCVLDKDVAVGEILSVKFESGLGFVDLAKGAERSVER